jgi:hypothetical protein
MTFKNIKKFLLYALKWQGGTPIMALVILLLPINNLVIKTIIANIIGAIIFYPIDNWIFGQKSNKKKIKLKLK